MVRALMLIRSWRKFSEDDDINGFAGFTDDEITTTK
jgi:hypothetical protein